jgi:hypothetical protein
VAAIVTRVIADGRDTNDLLAGLVRIGIDEISYRKGQRYLTVIVDHGTGRLVWAKEGRNQETLGKFFDELGAGRAGRLTHVSCDGADWIHALVRQRAPRAVICLDPFHVVAWAMKALDKVRVRTMAKAGVRDRHAMWATRKNPADLTGEQKTSMAEIAATNKALYRAYLLKEQLREVFSVKGRVWVAMSCQKPDHWCEFLWMVREKRRGFDRISTYCAHAPPPTRTERNYFRNLRINLDGELGSTRIGDKLDSSHAASIAEAFGLATESSNTAQ